MIVGIFDESVDCRVYNLDVILSGIVSEFRNRSYHSISIQWPIQGQVLTPT